MPLIIQSRWRAYLALQYVRARRQHQKAEFLAVLRIQLAWYRRQGDFATFVLWGCLREQVTRLFRNRNARVVQVAYRIFRRTCRRRAALLIQCIWLDAAAARGRPEAAPLGQGDHAPLVAEPGMCMRCATEEATRRCLRP
jgi:hypothetical protein